MEETYPFFSLTPHHTVEALAGKPPSKLTARKDVKRMGFVSWWADLLEHTNQRERVEGFEGLVDIVDCLFGETFSKEDY